VTIAGLDALFLAQQAAIKAAKALEKAAPKPAVTVSPAEIDVAKNVLYYFFKAMSEWHTSCVLRYEEAKKLSATGQVGDDVWEECRAGCREIFNRYCTAKTRVYGGPEIISIGGPPDYATDPDQEPITSIEAPSSQRIVIETKQMFVVHDRCQYVLLKKGGEWRIDSKKYWRAGWEQTIL
jgi:hypothetical protein